MTNEDPKLFVHVWFAWRVYDKKQKQPAAPCKYSKEKISITTSICGTKPTRFNYQSTFNLH